MLLRQIALVSQTHRISFQSLAQAGAALQKQVSKDLGPIWGIHSTVDVFEKIADVPLSHWPVIITDQIDNPSAAGYHEDENHQPYALVQYSESWSLTASHEIIEMLVDPWGNKMHAAMSVKPGQGKVQYLVETCDPCEDASFAYLINGILVSDFYTPSFFDPKQTPGTRYSFTGAITRPLELLKGGYMSWYEPQSDAWWQAFNFNNKIEFRELKEMKNLPGNLRSRVDRLTVKPDFREEHRKRILSSIKPLTESVDRSRIARGERLEKQIRAILRKK